MIPFLHLWRLTVPTYGLMVASAMLAAYYVVRADLRRRGIETRPCAHESSDAERLIAIPSLAGILGAKLYHVLETPREFFADPAGQLFSQFGFAWFGGLIAGFLVYVWIARRIAAQATAAGRRTSLAELLDAGSPAAALGYGIGRIGCFLSGDGDYGVPTSLPWGMSFPNGLVPTTARVHPTPIYELIVACAIAWVLWRMGARAIAAAGGDVRANHKNKISGASGGVAQAGSVFAAYLVLTGVARFAVEFIRINPRSFYGLTNAQAASVASVALGALVWWRAQKNERPRNDAKSSGSKTRAT